MRYWVYVHTCPNGKRYVGITTASKPEMRWKEGKGYQYNKYFYRTIKKYGWSSIKHEAWELTSESEMYYAEKYLIAYYHTTDKRFGYNNSSGGESGSSGCRYSEEHRKKLSEAQKKVHADPEYRKKLSEALRGKPKPHSEEHKRHIAEALKGKPVSEEVRKRIAENNRRRAKDPEFRKKLSESHKGKPNPHSEETKGRMAEARKKKWLDPEYRRKVTEACKNRPRISIKLPDGTIVEMTKQNLTRYYIKKGRKFEYVS